MLRPCHPSVPQAAGSIPASPQRAGAAAQGTCIDCKHTPARGPYSRRCQLSWSQKGRPLRRQRPAQQAARRLSSRRGLAQRLRRPTPLAPAAGQFSSTAERRARGRPSARHSLGLMQHHQPRYLHSTKVHQEDAAAGAPALQHNVLGLHVPAGKIKQITSATRRRRRRARRRQWRLPPLMRARLHAPCFLECTTGRRKRSPQQPAHSTCG